MKLASPAPALAMVLALGCKKPPPAMAEIVDATAPAQVASALASPHEAGAGKPLVRLPFASREAGAPERAVAKAPPLPIAAEKFGIVAVGKNYNARVFGLRALGSRMWMQASNVDAFAEGDGPLAPAEDLIAKLPYQGKVHKVEVTGTFPHVFALRMKDVNGRMESLDPTVFARTDDGAWKLAKASNSHFAPIAFVPFRDGAAFVTSQIEFNAGPAYFPPGPGTSVSFVAPDGTWTSLDLGLEPSFMAWDGDGAGENLSLLGTVAAPGAKGETIWYGGGAVVLVRVTKSGAKKVTLQRSWGQTGLSMYHARVHESGERVLVLPPTSFDDAWKPKANDILIVEGDKITARSMAGECMILDGRLVGDVVYVLRRCFSEEDYVEHIVSVNAAGKTESVPLPKLVKDGAGAFRQATPAEANRAISCRATSLAVGSVGDLWAAAKCGTSEIYGDGPSLPLVVRLGRPQAPVLIP